MRTGIAFLAVLMTAGGSKAQDTAALAEPGITADRAAEIALRDSPLLGASQAEVEIAAARVRAARAERRPSAAGVASLMTGDMPSVVASPDATMPRLFLPMPGEASASLNAVWMAPLYTGGRLAAGVRAASGNRAASESDREAMRLEVSAMARSAHHAVLARKELVRVWTNRLAADEERLRLDRARLAQEQIPAYYVQRSEAEVAATRQELVNARRDVELARVNLRTVIGAGADSGIDAAGALAEPELPALVSLTGGDSGELGLPPLSRFVEQARAARPELAAARHRIRAAGASVDSARARFRPQVDAMAMGGIMAMDGASADPGVSVGLVASIPLSTGGMRGAAIDEAAAERRRSEEELRRVMLAVEADAQSAWHNLAAAKQNVAAAQAALDAARAEYDAARLRYQVGRSVLAEELDALASRTRAEGNVVQALYELNVAFEDARRALGSR